LVSSNVWPLHCLSLFYLQLLITPLVTEAVNLRMTDNTMVKFEDTKGVI
jgi:hypothetical protein